MEQKAVLLALAIGLLLLSPVTFADFLDVSADSSVKTSSNVFIKGYVRLDNFSGIPNVNVSAVLVTSNVSALSSASGYFEFNLTAPATEGMQTITILTNTSLSRKVETNVRAFSTANITFLDKRPPFSNGSSFTINITFDGTPTSVPALIIFNPNGNATSGWTSTNITPLAQSIAYNITSPTAADGEYVLVVESGAGALFFLVRSSLTISLDVQDTSNATKSSFAPSSTANILAKIRNDDGPITTAAATAFITLPNSTVRTLTLSHLSSTNGTYLGAFTETSAAGSYNVRVIGNVSGRLLEANTFFSVLGYEAKLDIVKDFFFEFGGSSAFASRGQVSFNAIMFNKSSNDSVLFGSMSGAAGAVNCSAIFPVQLKNVQTSSVIPFTSVNITNSLGTFFGQPVCRINFTAPVTDGIYLFTVNLTVGNNTFNATGLATGYFSVQSYVLKASPVSSIGGGNDYLSSLIPGQNATFELSVKNLSSGGNNTNGSLVTNINVTRIIPLNFIGERSNEITNIAYTVTPGSDATSPRVTVVIPDNATGPFNIEFQVNITGTFVRGTAFYFAKYIEGFATPSNFYMGSSGGGPMPTPFKCGGTQTFIVKAFDVKTRQAAKNVVINSIQEARSELTGKSIKDLLSVNTTTVSDSTGAANLSLNFAAGSYSGFYFMMINVTTGEGKIDVIPGGFECKTLNFFPMLSSSGGFRVGPNSTILINVSNIRNVANATPYTVATGTASILRLENFDRSKGPKFYTSSISTSIAGGSALLNLTPSNFSLAAWPSGFNNIRVQVCDGATCDSSMTGFMSVAFDAFFNFGFQQPTQVSPRENLSFTIMARTNVSTINPGASTLSNFKVTIGQPWAGASTVFQGNATFIQNGWDNPTNFSGELWQINFTVPADVRKGGNAIRFEIKNVWNETMEIEYFLNIVKSSVTVPDTEEVRMTAMFLQMNHTNYTHINSINSTYTINLSTVNATLNVNSKSGRACAVYGFNATRHGPFQQILSYGAANTTMIVIDNATPNVYDTVVLRNGATGVTIAAHTGTAAARSLSGAGFPGLYLRRIAGCDGIEIINATASASGFGSGFGGQHVVNSNFIIPLVVKQGTTPRSGATVDLSQIVLQQDFGGGRGGQGFTGFLPATNFTKTQFGATDANGVAFIQLNVNVSGTFGFIWNMSYAAERDTAEFSQVIPFEVKRFNSYGSFGQNSQMMKVVNFTKLNSTAGGNNTVNVTLNVTGATVPGSPIYYAFWREFVNGELIADNSLLNYTMALRNITENPSFSNMLTPIGSFSEFVIDNEFDLNTSRSGGSDMPNGNDGFSPYYGNISDTFGMGQPPRRDIFASAGATSFAFDGNRTVDENNTQLLFAYAPMGGGFSGFTNVNSVNTPVTVRACASTFDRPQKPVAGAVVRMQVEVFANGPPVTETLNIIDPFTGSAVNNITTGPSGCATFNVTRTGGWTSGPPSTIKGNITSGTNTENFFVGAVGVFV